MRRKEEEGVYRGKWCQKKSGVNICPWKWHLTVHYLHDLKYHGAKTQQILAVLIIYSELLSGTYGQTRTKMKWGSTGWSQRNIFLLSFSKLDQQQFFKSLLTIAQTEQQMDGSETRSCFHFIVCKRMCWILNCSSWERMVETLEFGRTFTPARGSLIYTHGNEWRSDEQWKRADWPVLKTTLNFFFKSNSSWLESPEFEPQRKHLLNGANPSRKPYDSDRIYF